MSKIYEALKKAQSEKATVGEQSAPQPSPVQPATGPMPDSKLSPEVAEEYRKMINRITLKNPHQQVKAILITSSVHGEGASSVCSQFALSLAKGNQEKVLLLDANLRSPMLHEFFGLERKGGFVEFMEGAASAGDVVKKTNFPGLFVITSGEPAGDYTCLLDSPRLKEALAEWKRDYSYVLIDCSPILAYADAVVLSRLSDGVVLVVQAGKTRWEVIRRARETLVNVKVPILGVVLNRRQYVIPKRVYKRL
jgi:capsular exopolysaccharide synthesis family protein